MRYGLFLILSLFIIGCGAPSSGGTAAPDSAPAAGEQAATEAGTGDTQAGVDQADTGLEMADDGDPPAGEAAEAMPEATTGSGDAISDLSMTDVAHAELLGQVLFTRSDGAAALEEIRVTGDTRFVAGLVDSLRYRPDLREDIGVTLNALTGQELEADWFEWVEWAGNHPEIESFDDYPGWKAHLFAQIDPNFLRFVQRDMKVDPESRVEEIVWGGVRVDGIPALDNPAMIAPEEADYLLPDERVFGVSINGDSRAYPARFLDWHEMFNDVVGGEPVSLAY